ncbi:MAG TPA: TIM barrel protein [Tepidisphaeraceae bacterium]|jgi:sugar phosphate isomerase/epimerase|nr:TIM barrel protein [Tepidisphaeraceae bacterium]
MNGKAVKIGVMAESLNADARQAAQLARSMNFSGLLFNAYSPSFSIPDLSQTGRREFRHTLQTQQIELIGLRGDLGAQGFGPKADIDRLLHQIDRAMEAASGLAAPLLCLELGPLAEPQRQAKPKPTVTPEQAGLILLPTPAAAPEPSAPQTPVDQPLLDSVNSALREVAVFADRYSVTVAFNTTLASFAALEQILASARCSWFGIDLDPVAMLRDEWDMDEIFSRLGASILHVRAHDALKGSDRRTKPAMIGTGNVDWAELVSRLDQAGYRGWVTVDSVEVTDRVKAAASGLAHLQKIASVK